MRLVERSILWSCSEQTVEQINKDLDRTFPGHPLMDEAGKEALRQILVAFSLHRPDIGYCQVNTPSFPSRHD